MSLKLGQYVTIRWICDELAISRAAVIRKKNASSIFKFLWYKLEMKIATKPRNTPRPSIANISILRSYPMDKRIMPAIATFPMEFHGLLFL